MSQDDVEERTTYLVVVNHEEQYSIWPDYKEVPQGWRAVGTRGSKKECLEYIGRVWTDMRPLSLRKHMEAFEAQQESTPVRSQ
jgi:MbtH protein